MPLLGSLSLKLPVSERMLRVAREAMRRSDVFDTGSARWDAEALAPAEDAIVVADRPPRTLVYGPAANANRFQSLLYSTAGEAGVGLVPLRNFHELDELPLFGPFVCHFHWLNVVTKAAADEQGAHAKIDDFLGSVDRLRRSAGARIIWTAHNILPHDSRHCEADARLRREMIDRCDLVHCMTEDSVASLAERFDLSRAETFVVPHPSYEGAHPDYLDRAGARKILGIDRDAELILSFGAVQAYKGYDVLRAAFDRLRSDAPDRSLRLLIAGAPSDPAEVAELYRWADLRDDVTLLIEKIADEDLQLVFRAADVAVCPYRQTMNSGVAIMALSFGVPVVASRQGAFAVLEGEGVIVYDPDEGAEGCAAAMRAALDDRAALVEATGYYRRDHHPGDISRAFFQRIEGLWGR